MPPKEWVDWRPYTAPPCFKATPEMTKSKAVFTKIMQYQRLILLLHYISFSQADYGKLKHCLR